MTDEQLSTRRLLDSESEMWTELGEISDSRDHSLVWKFMGLKDSTVFVSSVGNTPIGGTAFYRERVQPGIAMLNTRIVPTWRERAAQIIESSLQLSCDSSMAHVDVLLCESDEFLSSPLDFPLGLKLDEWTRTALEMNGFQLDGEMCLAEYFIHAFGDLNSEHGFDNEVIIDDVIKLFWKSDMVCSHFWYLMDLHKEIGTIRTITIDDCVASCMGISKISSRPIDYAIVTILIDEEQPDLEGIVKLNMREIKRLGVKHVVFPLISYKQSRILDDFFELSSGGHDFSGRELMLYRKNL